MEKTINYYTIPEFEKDFKRLEKKYRTLKDDFERMKRFAIEPHYLLGAPTNAFVPIEGFCSDDYQSLKVRKFACMALKNMGNRTGIRVIFVYIPQRNEITFIEMYHKNEKSMEDRERLGDFIKDLQ